MPSGGHNRKPDSTRQSKRVYAAVPVTADSPVAPGDMTPAGTAMFAELLAAIPAGTAAKSDSLALSLAAELAAQFRQSPDDFPAGKLATLRGLLNDFALTPSARRKVDIEPVALENPFARIDRLRGA